MEDTGKVAMNEAKFFRTVYTYGRLIKFSHTVFALPFALSAVVLASSCCASVTAKGLFWIVVAVISARSSAMGFNRWVDRVYDKLNPRTSNRPSVTGEISPSSLFMLIVVSSAVFILSAYMLGKLCFYLSVPVLFVLLFYSYTKRFTRWCHLFLGFAISLAPVGAWIAVTGSFSIKILPLSIALMTYIAGFDILYSCMDIDIDKRIGIFSLPSTAGLNKALRISSYLHIITFASLISLIPLFHLGKVYLLFMMVIGALLYTEHRIVKPDDLSRIPVAFFHVNSAISILLFLGIVFDVMR